MEGKNDVWLRIIDIKSIIFSLQFLTGDNKNITFSPGNGASVWIGEEDIVQTLNDYRQLEARVGTIDSKLQTDNCRSSPCQNGGKCVSLYEGYHCECPKEKFFIKKLYVFEKKPKTSIISIYLFY